MKGLISSVLLGLLLASLLMLASTGIAASNRHGESVAASLDSTIFRLVPMYGSPVVGSVELYARPQGGTAITVLAFGLPAWVPYAALYHSNASCSLDFQSLSSIIGGKQVFSSDDGYAMAAGDAKENPSRIRSISLRDATTMQLIACADVSG